MKRFTRFGLASLIMVAAASCGASFNQNASYGLRDWLSQAPGLGWLDPVTAIVNTPEAAADRQIYLQGRVEQQLPLVEQGLYQLVDDTGAIWVVSPTSPPPLGETLRIRAAIRYKSIPLAGQDIGEHYAEELSRLRTE
jgi:hypothetical protein